MSYSPIIVANAVLHRAAGNGVSVDHMKLQKLVFLVHAWSLALNGAGAVNREPEAWTYGPVFGELYGALRNQGRDEIRGLIPSYNAANGTVEPLVPNYGDESLWRVVDQVLARYGRLNAVQLSTLSHAVGGPWEYAQKLGLGSIPDSVTQAYYKEQFARGNASV